MIRYVKNEEHYNLLLEQIANVRHTLWIGTADLKDLYFKKSNKAVPFLALLNEKVKQGARCAYCMLNSRERISAAISTVMVSSYIMKRLQNGSD